MRHHSAATTNHGGPPMVSQLRTLLAELDLLMAIDGFPTIADLHAAGALRI